MGNSPAPVTRLKPASSNTPAIVWAFSSGLPEQIMVRPGRRMPIFRLLTAPPLFSVPSKQYQGQLASLFTAPSRMHELESESPFVPVLASCARRRVRSGLPQAFHLTLSCFISSGG